MQSGFIGILTLLSTDMYTGIMYYSGIPTYSQSESVMDIPCRTWHLSQGEVSHKGKPTGRNDY